MLVSPIQINGVQSIPVSLGRHGLEGSGARWRTTNCWLSYEVCWSLWGAGLPALIGWTRSHTWRESQGSHCGHRGQEIIKHDPSPANALLFLAVLKILRSSFLPFSISPIFLISSFFFFFCLGLPVPFDRRLAAHWTVQHAEVGSATLLIPPSERITKWKWPGGLRGSPWSAHCCFLYTLELVSPVTLLRRRTLT